jgi:hypothetical protein
MRTFSFRSALLVLVPMLTMLVPPRDAVAQSSAPCVIGYTVGFFNGVWNTELDAIDGRNALQVAFREASGNSNDTYNDEDVSYQLFYNHTGSTVGATGLQDIAEVFLQRANELDPTGVLAQNNYYFFWESLGGATPGYAASAGVVNSLIANFMADFFNQEGIQAAVTTLSALFSSPPTLSDYAAQQSTLAALASAGRKFVLVAHSQGNLFVNQAYDYIQPIVGSTRVKAVHIAPASPTLRGQWVLADIDVIINGLRAANGLNSVPAVNLDIPTSSADISGHMLVDTYLDPTRAGRAATELLLTNAFSALQKASCAVTIVPASSNLAPGATLALVPKINPAPTDVNVQFSYAWTVKGNAGGLLSSGDGSPSTTVSTTAPTVNYVAASTAVDGQVDTVSVTAYIGAALADPTTDETLGTGAATVTINSSATQTPGLTVKLATLTQSIDMPASANGLIPAETVYYIWVVPYFTFKVQTGAIYYDVATALNPQTGVIYNDRLYPTSSPAVDNMTTYNISTLPMIADVLGFPLSPLQPSSPQSTTGSYQPDLYPPFNAGAVNFGGGVIGVLSQVAVSSPVTGAGQFGGSNYAMVTIDPFANGLAGGSSAEPTTAQLNAAIASLQASVLQQVSQAPASSVPTLTVVN